MWKWRRAILKEKSKELKKAIDVTEEEYYAILFLWKADGQRYANLIKQM